MADPNDKVMMDIRCNQLLTHSNVKADILEIGAGTGINFPCLHNNTNIRSYIGIEPNTHMEPYFNNAVNQWKVPFETRLLNYSATDMQEVQSNSIDTVIMTLVFCSIPDPLPHQVIREVHRILKPGGKFLFFEHISANYETQPFTYGFQRTIEPLWAIIGDGCRFKPMTNYFDGAKDLFSKVDYQTCDFPTPIFFVKEAIKGILIK